MASLISFEWTVHIIPEKYGFCKWTIKERLWMLKIRGNLMEDVSGWMEHIVIQVKILSMIAGNNVPSFCWNANCSMSDQTARAVGKETLLPVWACLWDCQSNTIANITLRIGKISETPIIISWTSLMLTQSPTASWTLPSLCAYIQLYILSALFSRTLLYWAYGPGMTPMCISCSFPNLCHGQHPQHSRFMYRLRGSPRSWPLCNGANKWGFIHISFSEDCGDPSSAIIVMQAKPYIKGLWYSLLVVWQQVCETTKNWTHSCF